MIDFILVFFAAVGVAMIIFGVLILLRSILSQSWPIVNGRIIESVLIEHGTRRRRRVRPSIRCQYFVSGQEYISDVVQFGLKYTTINAGYAQQLVLRYPVGSKVAIRVSPRNPALSVLEPGGIGIALTQFFIGALFVGCAIFLYKVEINKQGRPAKSKLTGHQR